MSDLFVKPRAPRERLPQSISIVVPCFNEEDGLAELHRRLTEVLTEVGAPYEIILVDDGSSDSSWKMMEELSRGDEHLRALRLSRNFGHQIALTCGLDHSQGEVTLIMDADLQDPPELLPQMLERWQAGFDIIYGVRRKREGEGFLKRFLAENFYKVFASLARIPVPKNTGDFRLLDRRAIETLKGLRETQRYVRGLSTWIGYPQTSVYFDRPQRFAGETKYSVKKSAALALDAITSFSYKPLLVGSLVGGILIVISLLGILCMLVSSLLWSTPSAIWFLSFLMLLVGGLQLVVLGILGEYLGRVFEQVKGRPLYILEAEAGKRLLQDENRDS